jgi:uncharacterized protein YndB with AHSA1/START domain
MTTPHERYATLSKIHDRGMRAERMFDASRDRVWAAYTEPALIAQWWGRGNRTVVERFEFVKGGHWRYVEYAPHAGGEQVNGFEGRYREITPKERIVRTFEWDGMPAYVSIESTTFVDVGDGRTKIIQELQCFTPDERDGMMMSGMEPGMNASYAALDALFARGG